MPNREDITYFGAGPALLPTDVLEKASQALLNYNDTGLGIAGTITYDWTLTIASAIPS